MEPRAYIDFGPTGRNHVTIRDQHGVELDLPVTSIRVSLDSCDDVAKATITLERVHVTAAVAEVSMRVGGVRIAPWFRRWWWRLFGGRTR